MGASHVEDTPLHSQIFENSSLKQSRKENSSVTDQHTNESHENDMVRRTGEILKTEETNSIQSGIEEASEDMEKSPTNFNLMFKCLDSKNEFTPPPGSPKPENTARLRRYRLKQV